MGTQTDNSRRRFLAGLALLSTVARGSARAQSAPTILTKSFQVPMVNGLGEVVSRYPASARFFEEDLGAGVSLDISLIPGGTGAMGSPSAAGHPEETPVHNVQLQPFGLGTNPITVGQWRRVVEFPQVLTTLRIPLRGPLPLEVENALPVDFVSWDEAVEFCARLQRATGRPYRLPSEAEWEYACRAGTTTMYHFGDGISLSVANFNDGIVRPIGLTQVGAKQSPNRYGLNDMHGNVQEWTQDSWHSSYSGAPGDGSPWVDSGDSTRVTRGGCFLFRAEIARSAARVRWDTRENASGLGLRVALTLFGGVNDPVLARNGVVCAASGAPGPIAPGEIVTVWGANIGPAATASLALDNEVLVTKALGGTRVLFDGVPAPLLFVSSGQVNAVVPYAVGGKTSTQVIVEVQGQTSIPVSVVLTDANPAVFTTDGSGAGQAAALNQDGTVNSVTNPARTGETVSLFLTGEGQTTPPGVDGKVAGFPAPQPLLPVRAFVGGLATEVLYAGGAPAEVAGVMQVNIKLPWGLSLGQQALIVTVGSSASQTGVFLVLQ